MVLFLQAQKEVPLDLAQCKDKFLVQVKAMDAGEVSTCNCMMEVPLTPAGWPCTALGQYLSVGCCVVRARLAL